MRLSIKRWKLCFFFYHNRFGPVKFEPFALSLWKGFDPSTSSGQAKLSLNGS